MKTKAFEVGSKRLAGIIADGGQEKSALFQSVTPTANRKRLSLGTDLGGTLKAFTREGKEVPIADLVLHGGMLQNSSALTSWAFQKGLAPIGDFGSLLVTICVFLFALSTMISWSYYGDRCVTYLVLWFGALEKRRMSREQMSRLGVPSTIHSAIILPTPPAPAMP